jgi:hypothetical protein
MATDPPAAPTLPEFADLDPAFDLSTFATERSVAGRAGSLADRPRPVNRARGASPSEEVRRLPDVVDSLPRRPWVSDSAIQLVVAAFLAIGAVAIVLLAVRGRQPRPAPASPPQQVRTESMTRTAGPATTARQPKQPPAILEPKPAKAGQARSTPTPPAVVPAVSARHAGRPVSTSGTSTRRRSASTPLRGALASSVPPAAAPVVIEHSNLNVNALPWANVWLDGRAIGETPLANLRVSAGRHELIFRHPELGERRVTTIVEAGVATRVTADLRQ